MKKNFLLFGVVFIASLTINAQSIQLDQSDVPVIGDVFYEVVDTSLFTGVSIGSTGPGQTWDMTNIVNQYPDTTYMVNPTSLPGFATFPTATVAAHEPGNIDTYCNLGPSAFSMLGIYGDFLGTGVYSAAKFNPAETYIALPSDYGTTFNGTTYWDIVLPYTTPPIDSIKVHFDVIYSGNIDAWGTVTTPSYSNEPCLRQKSYSTAIISSFIHMAGNWIANGSPSYDTSTTYTWYTKIEHFGLVTINVEPNGVIKEARYLASSQTVGMSEVLAINNTLQLFPNPASDVINISGVSSTSQIMVMDLAGKIVDQKMLNSNQISFSVSDYQPGIYFYNIIGVDGSTIGRGKFVVVK